MSDTHAKFTTEIEAVRWTGANTFEIFKTLGYHVEGNKIIFGQAVDLSVPQVDFTTSLHEPSVITLKWPHRELEVHIGMWVVRIGKHTTIMSDREFGMMKFVDEEI